MAANRRLARSIMDGAFHEFRRQLDYKATMYGATVIVADRWYPSSRTCSCCGSVLAELDLSQRIYRCTSCGLEIDRDLNAARNLEEPDGKPRTPVRGKAEQLCSEAGSFA